MKYIAFVGFLYLAAYAFSILAKQPGGPPRAKGGWWKDRYGVHHYSPPPPQKP